MIKIAVTGSSGFIGKYLTQGLLSANYEVIKLDKKQGYDLTDKQTLNRIPEINVIIHLAAKTFVPDSFKKPFDFYYENYLMTLNVLELAKQFSAKVIYFSSYMYGNPNYLPVDEDHPLSPHNPYTQSKLICEKICEGYNRDFDIPVIVFRPFNVYGKGQNDNFLIPRIINQIKGGKKIQLKDPRPRRDFLFISDLLEPVLKAINSEINFSIFNLGCGKSYSVREIVNKLKYVFNFDGIVEFTNEYRQNEVLDTCSDISKIHNILGWTPKVNIDEGVIKLI